MSDVGQLRVNDQIVVVLRHAAGQAETSAQLSPYLEWVHSPVLIVPHHSPPTDEVIAMGNKEQIGIEK